MRATHHPPISFLESINPRSSGYQVSGAFGVAVLGGFVKRSLTVVVVHLKGRAMRFTQSLNDV